MLLAAGIRRVAIFLLLLSSLGGAAHAGDSAAIRTTRVGFGRHAPRPDTSAIAILFMTDPPQEKYKKIARVEFRPAYYRNLDARLRDGRVTFTSAHRERFEALAGSGQSSILTQALIDAGLASKKQPRDDVRVRAESLATHRAWLDDTSRVAVELRRQVLPRMQEIEDALAEARRMGGEALLIDDRYLEVEVVLDPLNPAFGSGSLISGDQTAAFHRGTPVFDAWVVVRK